MLEDRPQPIRIAALSAAVVLVGAFCLLAYQWASPPTSVTAESYIAAKPGRTLAPASFAIGGRPAVCPGAKVVLDPGLKGLAVAYPGLIVLNSSILDRLPAVVGLFAFQHECRHHLEGPGEPEADCFAAKRGRADGWLDAKGADEMCAFWQRQPTGESHLPGQERCDLMRTCMAAP